MSLERGKADVTNLPVFHQDGFTANEISCGVGNCGEKLIQEVLLHFMKIGVLPSYPHNPKI